MYKTIRKIHLWLSVPFGLFLSLICFTGMILVFEPHSAGADGRPEFFFNVMRLHRWLFDVPPAKGMMTSGKLIVGISTIAMVLILISGIILWWLRARKSLTGNLKIHFNRGLKMFCSSLHTAGGAYVCIFLLIMALTGLTWSFGWYREGFNALFGIEKGSHIVYQIHTGTIGKLATHLIWFISALIGFTLPLTGYYMWINRLRLKRNNNIK